MSSVAYASNASGQVAGVGNRHGDHDAFDMFLWSEENGYEIIPSGASPGAFEMAPSFINGHEQVVGHFMSEGRFPQSMFYWDRESGWANLQDLLDPADPLSSKIVIEGYGSIQAGISTIPKINNRGEIVVSGAYKPEDFRAVPDRTFLLVPVSR